ncbi:MAG: SurA N-terminal domain-containing protein [Campylobacteraceae bacterium]|nr:SurA N-terminal domain-containing protein [Campylobacteraceae bacterium]
MGLKKVVTSFFCVLFLNVIHAKAELLDAISIIVENEPVTLFEIFKFSKQYNVEPRNAVDLLVRQKLELSQIKNMNIEISDFDIEQQINQIATRNNMSTQGFLSALAAQGINAQEYRNDVKLKMQRDKLYQYIVRDKFQAFNKDDVLDYYNKNQHEFTRVESFDVTRFQSKNVDSLKNLNSPTAKSKNVESAKLRLYSQSSEARVIAMLTNTDEESFSNIIETKDDYIRFFLHKKNDISVLPFEQAENMIAQKVAQDKEMEILSDYFEKLKSRSTITVIRLP